jgi:hypothetical protein
MMLVQSALVMGSTVMTPKPSKSLTLLRFGNTFEIPMARLVRGLVLPGILDSAAGHKVIRSDFVGRALLIVVVVLSMFVMAPVMVPVVVRVVVVLNTAAISVPVTCVVPFAVVVWSNPASPLVGWASPIAFMPFVMVSHRIPITLDPRELRSWPFWHNHNHSSWRWRGNHDSNGNLCFDYGARG